MDRSVRWAFCILLVATVSACGDGAGSNADIDNAPAADGAATPTAAAPASGGSAGDQADDYRLTMENVNAMFEAQKNLAAAAKLDPGLEDFIGMNASLENGAQYAQRLAGHAKARSLIEKAGLSTSDYALTAELLVSAMMAHGAVAAGLLDELPEGISPQAVEFVNQHNAELTAKMRGN